MPPMTGRVIAGRYILEQPIGRGAMGVVWRARDQLLDREVAIKEVVLSSSIGADERKNAYQRTLREARTAARLSHRGVVTVYDVAEEDGRPWIVMELVPSRSLDQVLAVERRLTPLRAGRIGQQLLAALAAAHAAGVLHRDVKPSNVLIARDRAAADWDERAVLTDFGIAQFEGDPRLTQTGMVMGSPGFTAPERIRGGSATPASDLWSLGATIYAAVEGRGPYEQRGGAITTMSAIINEDAPVAPSAGRLAPLIAALLRREPSARPSAAAAARMFSEVLPLLSGVAADSVHPATVRSAYVPPPAAPVASAPAGAAPAGAAPAGAAAEDLAEGLAEGPADAGADAGADEAVAAAAGPGAGVMADVAAADDMAADEIVPAKVAVPAEVAAPAAAGAAAVGAAALEAAVAAAPAPAAGQAEPTAPTSLDAVPEDLVAPREDGATPADGGERADDMGPSAGSPAPLSADLEAPAAGPAPTQLSMPVAPPPVRSAPPVPTFTASGHTQQAGPSFSASRPAPPVPAQPAPSFSASRPVRPGDPPTTPQPAYESPQYGDSNAQYAQYGSNAQYPGPNAQYAGPSQAYPDLARQYSPGTGGRAQSSGRRGRRIALIAAAVVVAAAAGGGAALALHNGNGPGTTAGNTAGTNPKTPFVSVNALNNPSTALPAGWTSVTVQPSGAGTTAGFTIDLPPGWSEHRSGKATNFNGPGGMLLKVDLTAHTYSDMVTEARFIKQQSLASGTFPGYQQNHLQAVPVRGTSGAFWQFTWTPAGGVKMLADDILFIKPTSAGSQSYALYFRGPSNGWGSKYLPLFAQILRTFQTVPS